MFILIPYIIDPFMGEINAFTKSNIQYIHHFSKNDFYSTSRTNIISSYEFFIWVTYRVGR